jgi:hypothetical protein
VHLGILTGRDWLAGLGLALVTVRPQIAILLGIPFLFRRRSVFLWFCLGAAALGFVSLLLLGWEGVLAFLNLMLVSAGGEFYGMHESAMVNLVGLLTRIIPDSGANLIHWIGWGTYLGAILVLCLVWIRNQVLDERHFALAVILSVFFAPHLHYHDLALLLIPLVGLMSLVVRKGEVDQKTAALLPMIVSLSLLLGSLIPVLKYNLPCLLMVFLALALWFPASNLSWRSKKDEILP